jgi:hypothetical protein
MKTITLQVEQFKTPTGEPTCALNWAKGKVCPFVFSTRMGTVESCHFGGEIHRKGGEGFMIPVENCKVWNDKA